MRDIAEAAAAMAPNDNTPQTSEPQGAGLEPSSENPNPTSPEAGAESTGNPVGAEVAAPDSIAPDSNRESAEDDTSEGESPDESTEAAAETSAESAPAKKKRRRRKKKPASPGAEAGATESHHPPARPSVRASDRTPFRVGEEVYGKVTAVLDAAIMVDLSGKALAVFDRSEMAADDLVPGVGDRMVAHIHNDGARGGLVVLTRKPLREEETKPLVEKAHQEGTLVSGLITGVIRGGVEVDVGGLRAFAPASGMDLHPANANFTGLVGQRMDFKVVQYEKNGRDVVVSRRSMLESEAHERRKQALSVLEEGQVLDGVVRTVVEWGVFVAMPAAENLEGLVHVTEASHDPYAQIAELYKPGDKIQVKITKIDERGKIWLSRKALIDDPWAAAREKYGTGTRHTGTVKHLEDFGAFITLEPAVEGLLHIADLSLERIEHAKEKLEVGATVEVVVAHVDTRNRRLSLHLAPTGERASEPVQRVARNAIVKVEISKIEASGLVVRILGVTGRAARGFIPAGQTGTPRGTELRKAFKLNGIIDAKVVDIDPKRGEAKLSIRELADDEERRATREYRQKLSAQGGFGTLGDLFRGKLGGSSTNDPQS
jgi:small subunit ribosomal protein S1